MIKDIWVVEYSRQQNCFHVTTLIDSVETNRKMFKKNIGNDYQVIGLANSYEKANDLANQFKHKYKYNASKTKEIV